MYSWELKKFIEDHDYYLGGIDLEKVISLEENPQLTKITFYKESNLYRLQDKYGNGFLFTAMNYDEALEKGLVRKLKK